jgi:hypothetical protein
MALFRTNDYTMLEWREDNTKTMRHYSTLPTPRST